MVKFWEKTMNYKWVKLLKLDNFKYFELNTYFYRVFCELSENHKIIEMGQPELEL